MNRETEAFLPSSLVVNIEEIDDQHADLFSRLSKLKDLCVETNTLPAGEAESILEILRVHCATEERLAKESGLRFTEHAKKHKTMLSSITKAIKEVQEGKIDVFSVLRYVEYWFERHIIEEDQNLARNLQQISNGMFDPEHSFAHARASAAPPAATNYIRLIQLNKRR